MSLETPPPVDDEREGSPTSADDLATKEREDLDDVIGSPLSRALRLGALVALIVLLGITQGLSMMLVVAAIVVMIFLHELGHYVMAKRAGMLVTEFFLGFGPRIWSFRRGETEYGIKAIPAGAYVKIIGMSNMEEVEPELESRTYRQATFPQRIGVAVAGSTMHFLLAFLLLVVQFAFIGDPTTQRWAVGDITPGSAAQAAGLRQGDQITSFDGAAVPTFGDFRAAIADSGPGVSELTVLRDGEDVVVPVALSRRVKLIGTIGEDVDVIDNGERLLVGDPFEGGRAEAAGLVGGSTLLSVNDQPVSNLDDVTDAAAGSRAGVVVLGTEGGDAQVENHRIDLGTQLAATEPTAFVGVGSQPVMETVGPVAAVGEAAGLFASTALMSIEGVGRFIWPPNMLAFITDALSGAPDENTASSPTEAASTPSAMSETRPISIIGVAMLGSDLTSENLSSLVMFLATINIFIGVFNLFPMLPFDGGHVVIACYERAQELRQRSTQRYLADVSRLLPVAYGVVAVLAIVGLLAMFVDVTRGVSL